MNNQIKKYWQVRIDGKLSIIDGRYEYGRDLSGRICPVSQIIIDSHFYVAGRTLKTSGHRIEFIKPFKLHFPSSLRDPVPAEYTFLDYTTEKETVQ